MPGGGRFELAVCLGLAALAFGLYARTGGYPFTNFDDSSYVADNPHVALGLTWSSVTWAFSTLELEFWHPLTWLSYLVDVSLFGLRPGPMHLVNAGLHAASSVLLFVALVRLTRAAVESACAAALFAVHPIHVESVAWISERKDVLSVFFGLLALVAYARYARRPTPSRLAPVVAAFAASLLAKSMLVTLPFLLLLLDVWPLRRVPWRWTGEKDPSSDVPEVGWGRAVVEKLPLLAMSITISSLTMIAQLRGGSVVTGPGHLRLDNVIVSYARYLGRLLWPADLAVFYPLPQAAEPTWKVVAALAAVALVTACAVAVRRRAPWFTVGWLWFAGTLVPVSGLVRVGAHAMADRYAYFPFIGLYIALAWGIWRIRWRPMTRTAPVIALGVLVVLAFRTDRQLRLWSDDERLFRHAIAATGPNPRAQEMLANVLRSRGRDEEAYGHLLEAVRILPHPRPLTALGSLSMTLGHEAVAEKSYETALALDPRHEEAALALAGLLVNRGEVDRGIAVLEGVLAHAPGDPEVLSTLSVAWFNRGDAERAERYALQAVSGGARSAGASIVLGALKLARGDAAAAVEALERAVKIDPEEPFPRLTLAGVLASLERLEEACEGWAFVLRSPRATSEDRERARQAAKHAGCDAPRE